MVIVYSKTQMTISFPYQGNTYNKTPTLPEIREGNWEKNILSLSGNSSHNSLILDIL